MGRNIPTDPFSWKEEYNVNVSVIDDQHKKFLRILDLLRKGILEKPCSSLLKEFFSRKRS